MHTGTTRGRPRCTISASSSLSHTKNVPASRWWRAINRYVCVLAYSYLHSILYFTRKYAMIWHRYCCLSAREQASYTFPTCSDSYCSIWNKIRMTHIMFIFKYIFSCHWEHTWISEGFRRIVNVVRMMSTFNLRHVVWMNGIILPSLMYVDWNLL